MKKIIINNIKIQYNENNIKIINSYKITDEYDMFKILWELKFKIKYRYKRTISSWLKEWKTHNFLYKHNLFIKHTKDCDLEEKEKKYRLIIYNIIGGII